MNSKQLVTSIPEDIFRKFKLLAAEKLVTMKSLLLEAIIDLLNKYEN